MKRITRKLGKQYFIAAGLDEDDWKVRNAVIQRLGAYEDTGLEPKEIIRLEEANRKGRLLELPRRVGDEVWILEKDEYGYYDGCAKWVLIGGNRNFAFLSPILDGLDDAMEICSKYCDEIWENGELSIAVVPWEEVYTARAEAEAAMEEEDHEADQREQKGGEGN